MWCYQLEKKWIEKEGQKDDTQRRWRRGQWARRFVSSALRKAASLKFRKVKFVQAGYRTGRYKALASHKPERVCRFLQFLKAFSSSACWLAVSSCVKVPVPSSANWGAWLISLCSCSKFMLLLTFKTLNDLHRLTSLSRASKLTSLLRLAKFSISSDVKVSGKQLNQQPLLSSTSFSCMSSSTKFLYQINVINGQFYLQQA